ncbi:MAG: hypothetical protein WC461_01365 [Candidatus Paceibacterota bacterium]
MINKIKNLIFLPVSFFALFAARVNAAGLVPCGGTGEAACNWCYFGDLALRIINFMMYLIFPLAAVMIVIGGIFIITSGGSSDRFSRGKEMITAAVIGILIALLSWIILDTIISTLATGFKGIVGPWNNLKLGPNC